MLYEVESGNSPIAKSLRDPDYHLSIDLKPYYDRGIRNSKLDILAGT